MTKSSGGSGSQDETKKDSEESNKTKLGKFKVPPDSKAGASDACKGEGTNGLQKDFELACKAFVKEAKDNGVTITLGYSGYVSKKDAEKWSKNGNPPFLANIKYFGWGLGWEITEVKYSCGSAEKASDKAKAFFSSWISKAQGYGITMVQVGAGESMQLRFLKPMNIEVVDSATEVSYAGDNTSVTDTGSGSSASVSSVAYFFANQFNSIENVAESYALRGERALANDEPVWDSVKKACNASMRSCASGPGGEFIAWYPDYWGMYGNKVPYLVLEDIELIDLKITQSDNEFYSHVYVPGVNLSGSSVSNEFTQGVVSIESGIAASASSASANDDSSDYYVSDEVAAILKEMINIPEGDEWKYTPKELYRRYGARPYRASSVSSACGLIEIESESDETNPTYILPFLYALYEFMKHWANQYQVSVSMTFMPELFPGCRVKLKSMDLSFYVEEVTHTADYSSGFTTNAKCSCPIGSIVSGMVKPNM